MEATHSFEGNRTGLGSVGPHPVQPGSKKSLKVLLLLGNSLGRKTDARRSPVGLREDTLRIKGDYTGSGCVGP